MLYEPSSLTVARDAGGWWLESEEFYLAGKILFENILSAKKVYYNEILGTNKNSKEVRMKMMLRVPCIFNLSFSIELLVKTILIKSDPVKWIPSQGNVKFGHDIYSLMINEISITLTEDESKVAKRIGEYVSYGKYPERSKPGNISESYGDRVDFHPYANWSLNEFFEIISSLRNKLRNYFLDLVKE